MPKIKTFGILSCVGLCLMLWGCAKGPQPITSNEPPLPLPEAQPVFVAGVATGLTQLVNLGSDAICPNVSMDGSWVAFAGDSEPPTSDSRNWDIYVTNSLGGGTIKLTEDKENIWEQNPCWMPDNRYVVYDSDYPEGRLNLWKRPYDGGGAPMKLTSDFPNAFHPSVSQDGEKIAYTVGGYTADNDFLNSAIVTPSELNEDMAKWYLQGAQSAPQIWILDLKTQSRTFLTEGIQPALCPDGEKIAFTKLVGGKLQIWTINLDGSRLMQLVATGGHDMEPCWSPSGQNLAFVSGGSGYWKIWAVRGRENYPAQITSGQTNEGHPSWGPGGFLFFHSDAGFKTADSQSPFKIWKAKIQF